MRPALIYQICLTFIIQFLLWMLLFFYSSYVGIASSLILLSMGWSIMTIVVCLFIGYPLRFLSINKRNYISIILSFLGLLMFALAFMPIFLQRLKNGSNTEANVPNFMFSFLGLFLFAVSTLHFYLPDKSYKKNIW